MVTLPLFLLMDKLDQGKHTQWQDKKKNWLKKNIYPILQRVLFQEHLENSGLLWETVKNNSL